MGNKIILAELQMQGEKHVHVNSGLLQIVKNTYNNNEITVYCDIVHEKGLSKHVSHISDLQFSTFKYTGDVELLKKNTISKVVREASLAYQIFKRAKKDSAEVIIFASAFPFTAPILNLLSVWFEQTIIICLHGDIGVLALRLKKITTKLFAYAIRYYLVHQGKKVISLIYGTSIRTKLFSILPEARKGNYITIDHPYTFKGEIKEANINEPIIIASIGTGIMNKNSHYIYKLGEQCAESIALKRIKIIQIGNVSEEVRSFSNKYVTIMGDNGYLSAESFEASLLSTSYFVYFFTEGSLYDLCPSGTFFDAIKYQTPIIALHNPFFDYYFKKLGNIGYLCDSVDEMANIICEISDSKKVDEYNEQRMNMLNAQRVLSIENISSSFSEQYAENAVKLSNAKH